MSLSTLLGTKWAFNATVTAPTSSATIYNLIGVYGNTGESLPFSYFHTGIKKTTFKANCVSITYNSVSGSEIICIIENGYPKYKQISISGGTDVTNADLIAWFEANAIQIKTKYDLDNSLVGTTIPTGSHSVTVKATATGYTDSDPSTAVTYNLYTITPTLSHATAGTNSNYIFSNGIRWLEYYADTGYVLPSTVSISGAVKNEWFTTTTYSITPTVGTGITASSSNPTEMDKDRIDGLTSSATLTYTLNDPQHYSFSSIASVSGATGVWSTATGVMTLTDPTDDILFVILAEGKQFVHSITITTENCLIAGTTGAHSYTLTDIGTTKNSIEVDITADGTSYILPTSFTVNGTTISANTSTPVSGVATFLYTRTDDTTGKIKISNADEAATTITFTVSGTALPQLATPDGVSTETPVVSWNSVTNAENYNVYVDGEVYDTYEES